VYCMKTIDFLFVCLFVCWNKTRKTILRLLLQGKYYEDCNVRDLHSGPSQLASGLLFKTITDLSLTGGEELTKHRIPRSLVNLQYKKYG